MQISPTKNQLCGIALFAERFASGIGSRNLTFITVSKISDAVPADLMLIHHHPDFFTDRVFASIVSRATCPVVIFAHADGIESIANLTNGIIAMHPRIVPEGNTPALVFPHPARIPSRLSDRTALRKRFGLPRERKMIGSSGFLRFERQFVEILSKMLPIVAERGWVVQLNVSPWYIESSGLLDEIIMLKKIYFHHFIFCYKHFSDKELNLRQQACDILWCWTGANSSPYASGVASDLYASGTMVIAANKTQHEHILSLPNVVRAPAVLPDFVDALIKEIEKSNGNRHNPAPISWEYCTQHVEPFLRRMGGNYE